jgi:two-component system, sensor histidine kinase and response regulator
VGNAIKFTHEGGVLVRVSTAESPGSVRFEVVDTGIGITAEAQARLFQPFVQADTSTTRQYGGTGLGLAISHRLTEAMRGTIGVRSEPGRGSTFWFTVPFATTGAPPSVAPLRARRVLVVDGQEVVRAAVVAQLQGWNVAADEAADGVAAMDRLRAEAERGRRYDVALVGRAEAGALAQAVALDPTLAGMAIVGLSPWGQRTPITGAGIAGTLTKPVRPSQLREALLRALDADGVPARGAATTPTPAAAAGPVRSLHILVAEDNVVNQRLAARMLEKAGHRADLVGNGQDAVAAIGRACYDLVLMDCQMPQLDGFEATRAIRVAEAGSDRHVPIVALTANAMEGDRERCVAAGMDDYLSKPFTKQALAAVLERWVS